ncbi:MAG TPA: hypothetical protein VMS73_03475 [Anaerolineaceae bacterium]|nr:hypothetical protein [Anaerolineaceae bacterium]
MMKLLPHWLRPSIVVFPVRNGIGLPLFNVFILVIAITGRKSGKPRCTLLEYRRERGAG